MYLTFQNPMYLWFLFLIPLLIISHFYFFKKSKAKAIKFANYETLKRISGENLITKNLTHLVLRVLIIFFLVVAVTGTQLWFLGEGLDTNIVLALDGSPSMTAGDISPNRFSASKESLSSFILSFSERTNLALITFGGTTFVNQPLTSNRLDVQLALSQANTLPLGGTDISNAIVTSTNLLLSDPDSGRTIIMLTDGVSNVGGFIADPIVEAVKYARDNQVIIHTITIGTDSGPAGFLQEYYELTSVVNQETAQYISSQTNGQAYVAVTKEEIDAALQSLVFSSSQRMLDYNVAFYSLVLALLLLFVDWILINTAYRRLI
ncbi:MAG: vWA domain-containing protein [Candidatus Woesearchaeota archaeon]